MKLELYFLVIFGYWIKNGECVPPLQMICFPVEEAMCTESVNHNFSPRFKDNENASPAHRKSTGKRNVQEMDLIHWPYNNSGTVYPSFADDKSSAEVKTSFSYLHPLIATKCSRYIKLFLCSVHTPVCTPRGIVPPCRELCKQVKSECEPVAEMFNIDWPDVANCDLFPHYNPVRGCADNVKTEALAAPQQEDEWTVVHRTSSIVWAEALLDNGQVCLLFDCLYIDLNGLPSLIGVLFLNDQFLLLTQYELVDLFGRKLQPGKDKEKQASSINLLKLVFSNEVAILT